MLIDDEQMPKVQVFRYSKSSAIKLCIFNHVICPAYFKRLDYNTFDSEFQLCQQANNLAKKVLAALLLNGRSRHFSLRSSSVVPKSKGLDGDSGTVSVLFPTSSSV